MKKPKVNQKKISSILGSTMGPIPEKQRRQMAMAGIHTRVVPHRVVSLKKFFYALLYEAALQWKDCEASVDKETLQLLKDCLTTTLEYSLRQLYRNYVGHEFSAPKGKDRGLHLLPAIGYVPDQLEFFDGKPKVHRCVERLIDMLLEDAGRDHLILLCKS